MLSINIGLGWLLLLFVAFVAVIFIANWYGIRAVRNLKESMKTDIAVVTIEGVLLFSSKPSSRFQKLMAQLERVKALKAKALILRINSPGGSAGASHEIYEALMRLKEKGVKIIALMEDVAASGGVYVAMAADYIIATPGVITGSIGVIIKHFDLSAIYEKIGVKSNSIKTGDHKDILSMAKPMSGADVQIMQAAIDDCYAAFCQIVAISRRLDMADVLQFADGRVFSAQEAKKLGLIDEVGGYNSALATALVFVEIEKEEEAAIHEVTPPAPLLEKLGMVASMTSVAERLDCATALAEMSGKPLWMMP